MVDSNQSRFDTSHALHLFPTFVWKADLKRKISSIGSPKGIVTLIERVCGRAGCGRASNWNCHMPPCFHRRQAVCVYYFEEGGSQISNDEPLTDVASETWKVLGQLAVS